MVVHISKKITRKQVDAVLKKIGSGKKLDAKKFCGSVKWSEDGLAYQLRLRDEWD
jgi:hypothetical protein